MSIFLLYTSHTEVTVATSALPVGTSSGCAKCGTIKNSAKHSCCARGGSWFKNCGNPGDSKFDHTWVEGIEACASVPTTKSLPGTRTVNGKPCAVENIMIVNQRCFKEFPHSDHEGMVCANDGNPNEAYCSYEVGDTACAYCKPVCSKCGTITKTGKPSCCARGGDWFKNCGSDGDPNFDHTWNEGVQACKRKFLVNRMCQHLRWP